MLYNYTGDSVNKITKIIICIMILSLASYITLNEINQYNLRKLKEETLEISKTLKNKYDELTQINIEKKIEEIPTRGEGKAFVEGENVTVILSYKDYCSVKIPGIEDVSLSKTKCQNLELINGEIVLVE